MAGVAEDGTRYEVKKGGFVKPCPGTPRLVCCGYRIIDIAHGCPLGCTYCILGHYFDREGGVVVFENREKLFVDLDRTLRERKGLVRLGTGEFTDSLALDEFQGLYRALIPNISGRDNAVLELKTKKTDIKPLLSIEPRDHTILSWSLNSETVAREEEKGAPPVRERVDAAARACEAGYKVAFHFDPIVLHEGWESGYASQIESLFRRIPTESIVYVSMGTLRFPPAMKDRLTARGGRSWYGEFVRGDDGKMRYFRPLRVKAYRALKTCLNDRLEDDRLYLCMESTTVWEDVFGIERMSTGKLTRRLDSACRRAFPNLLSSYKNGISPGC